MQVFFSFLCDYGKPVMDDGGGFISQYEQFVFDMT